MNVIIVHGSFGKPFENWFPWMEEKLAEKGMVCTIPTFPTPSYQEYKEWEVLLDYYYKRGFIDSQSVLIGHSCGAVFIVKYLINHNIHVKGIITVAGYNGFKSGDELMDRLNSSFYLSKDEIKRILTLTDKRISFYSDNDPFIPYNDLDEFADNIGAEKIMIKNSGHFNATAGYLSFKKILDVIESFI